MAFLEGKKSSNEIIINDTMSDDDVVASGVPRFTCSSPFSFQFVALFLSFFFSFF